MLGFLLFSKNVEHDNIVIAVVRLLSRTLGRSSSISPMVVARTPTDAMGLTTCFLTRSIELI